MNKNRDEGLGGSLTIFAIVLLGALTLFALPVYFLTGGTKLQNPGLAAYLPPPGATLIRRRDPSVMELSVLKRAEIIDAGQLAAISAKSKAPERVARAAKHTPRARDDGPVADIRYSEQPRRGLFFGLF